LLCIDRLSDTLPVWAKRVDEMDEMKINDKSFLMVENVKVEVRLFTSGVE